MKQKRRPNQAEETAVENKDLTRDLQQCAPRQPH